ncbi:MAG: AAA family ATPase [Actinomycetota bacterium]|nr:AAA family ATPase [Actinomycetota bacterium]
MVGPNNAGKSVLLSETAAMVAHTAYSGSLPTRTLQRVTVRKSGSYGDLVKWLARHGVQGRRPNNHLSNAITFYSHQGEVPEAQLRQSWENQDSLGDVARLVMTYQMTDGRLQQAAGVGVHNLETDEPRHPLQLLWMYADQEASFSALFRRAFGQDISINRYVQSVDLKIGRPELPDTAPPPTQELLSQYTALSSVMEQGDGVRSFAGLLLQVLVPQRHRIVLVDEPEAFLHPPQANLLARYLAERAPTTTQMMLATHSQDVVQGVLDASADRAVQIVRLTRSATGSPRVTVLPPDLVRELTGDTFLQNSNVLNGLFHDGVVICEADADCTYYRLLIQHQYADHRLPDIMFTQVVGKARVASVTDKLRRLSIPCASVVDFDVLAEAPVLQRIVTSAGGDWGDVEPDLNILHASVEDPAGPTVRSLRTALDQAVMGLSPPDRLDHTRKKIITDALRATSGWGALKRSGLHGVAQGAPEAAARRLLATLRQIGVFVVPVGELERWHPSVEGKSNEWLAAVLDGGCHVTTDQHRTEFVTGLVDFLADACGRPPEPIKHH